MSLEILQFIGKNKNMTNKNTRGTIHKLHCVVVALIQTVVVGDILFSRDLALT